MTDVAGEEFPQVALETWLGKAAPDGREPVTSLDDGITARWLYTRDDELAPDPGGVPGAPPFTRGARPGLPWEIRQEHAHPDRSQACAQILEDLDGGVQSVVLRLDDAARDGVAVDSDAFAAARARGGLMISTVDDLDEALDGVLLDLAPIALDAGAQALAAGAMLVALARRRGIADDALRGALRYDPLGTLASEGELDVGAEDALSRAGELAAEVDGRFPAMTALAVDTRAYVDAGATPAQELAIAVTTAIAYLRACDAAGLEPTQAAAQIELSVAVGADQFIEIAKLRALRRLWSHVLGACGDAEAAGQTRVYARTSSRGLAAVDPWTNMLRATTGAFAAAVGGADGITVTTFDAPLGQAGGLGRRLARNTQMILLEESGLRRVADPGGGSWYVESLTDDLARTAWERVQAIEAGGGIVAALRSGMLAEGIAASTQQRTRELATRVRRLTGVNTFPLLADDRVELEHVDTEELVARDLHARAGTAGTDASALGAAPADGRLAAAIAFAERGARIDELAAGLAGEPERIVAFAPVRESREFERLRSQAGALEQAGERPRVLLACLGPIARHVNSATWARSFFEAGGIHAIVSEPQLGPDELGAALRADGAAIAVVCGAPDEDPETIAATVAALRDAGAALVYLASADTEQAAAAGADEGIDDGADMVDVLARAQAAIGERSVAR
jgi:methylmalonyl-CoA mutase